MKLSKRLLAMLLVAVMVVAAIPFGAFAADQDYELIVKIDGVVEFDDTITYDDTAALTSDADTANALLALTTLTQRVGSGYDLDAVVDSRSAGKIGLKITTTPTPPCAHSWVWNGVAGNGTTHKEVCSLCSETRDVPCTVDTTPAVPATCDKAGKTEYKKCSVCGWEDGGEAVEKLGHVDANKDGICDRNCGEKNLPVETKTYKVVLKKSDKATTLASGKSVTLNEAQVNALNTASAVRDFLNTLGDSYATYAGKMADDDYKGTEAMTSSTGDSFLYIYMVVEDSPSQLPNTGDTFDVIFHLDNGTSYTRTVNVGDWYFNAGMAGNANGWGNKQVSLRITNALGSKRLVDWNSKDSSAYVQRGDVSVEILSKLKTVKIVFLKNEVCSVKDSNGTTVEYEWGSTLGELPELPYGYGYWCVDGKEITSSTTYNWELDKVYARPVKQTADHNGNVHLFVYNSSNQLMKDFDVTDKVQETNGMLFLEDLVSIIKSRTGVSSVSSAGLMDESGWAYYLNNKNSTKYAKSGLLMGTAAEREGVQNVYVVLKNVSGNSNADTSNPKTGDTAMIGTAAVVMALAVVGMGTVFYMKKREMI